MSITECVREPEALEAALSGCWPGRCDAELRHHVSGCATCAELVEVVSALREERQAAWHGARVPAAGLVWWRAQKREREQAARVAATPIAVVHLAALVCTLAGAAALLGGRVLSFSGWAAWLRDTSSLLGLPALALPDPALLLNPVVLLALGAWLVLAPLAVYLAVARD